MPSTVTRDGGAVFRIRPPARFRCASPARRRPLLPRAPNGELALRFTHVWRPKSALSRIMRASDPARQGDPSALKAPPGVAALRAPQGLNSNELSDQCVAKTFY